jgi:predicted small secreted protein
MKKINYYIKAVTIAVVLAAVMFSACTKLNDTA